MLPLYCPLAIQMQSRSPFCVRSLKVARQAMSPVGSRLLVIETSRR